ncbi:MAG: hypothetical protein ACQESC_01270 [Nanobdellota archaeon]
MDRTVMDVLRQLLPLSKYQRKKLGYLKGFLDADAIKDLKFLLKAKRIGIVDSPLNISKSLSSKRSVSQFTSFHADTSIKARIEDLNTIIKDKELEFSFKDFSSVAYNKIKEFVAPHILGFDAIKIASMLQLFSKERFHLLLLGDPGTGKTDIIRSTHDLAPIGVFGLGSGASGAGLSVMFKGDEMKKGLLPRAHKGICAIDELNLMKSGDTAALYSAMEKGFVTYDKGGKHEKIPAEVSIQATANPKADRFVGKSLSILKEQIPFDSALLSRFHLVFIIRRPGVEKTASIAKQIVTDSAPKKRRKEDIDFIKRYVSYALEKDVFFDPSFESIVTDFIRELKSSESNFVVEIGPRTVHGVMRLSQAIARCHLRSKTLESDVKKAIALVRESLKVEGIIRP